MSAETTTSAAASSGRRNRGLSASYPKEFRDVARSPSERHAWQLRSWRYPAGGLLEGSEAMIVLDHYGTTDAGRVRSNNEDALLAGEGEDASLFAVAG